MGNVDGGYSLFGFSVVFLGYVNIPKQTFLSQVTISISEEDVLAI
jgi:hypothetical protein